MHEGRFLCRSQKAGTESRASSFLVYDVSGRMKCISWPTSQKVCCTYLANELTALYHIGCHVLLPELMNGMLHLIIVPKETRVIHRPAQCSSPACQVACGNILVKRLREPRAQTHKHRDQMIGPKILLSDVAAQEKSITAAPCLALFFTSWQFLSFTSSS